MPTTTHIPPNHRLPIMLLLVLALLLFAVAAMAQDSTDTIPVRQVYYPVYYPGYHQVITADVGPWPKQPSQPPPTKQKHKFTLPVDYHYTTRRDINAWLIGNGLAFISGFSYGIREVVQHHPHKIPQDWNQNWWNTKYSWDNKYFQDDKTQGRTMVPVMFTDAYHLSGTVHRWSAVGSGICIGINSNNRWDQIAMNALISMVMFQVGFTLTYRTDAFFR